MDAAARQVVEEKTARLVVGSTVLLTRPFAHQIKEVQASLQGLKYQLLPGRVLLEGRLIRDIYYLAPDGSLHHQREESRLSQGVELEGATVENTLEVDWQVTGVNYCLDWFLGLRYGKRLSLEVITEASARLVRFIPLSPEGGKVWLETERVRVDRLVAGQALETLEEMTLDLPEPAERILETRVTVNQLTHEVVPGQVILQGDLSCQVYWVASGGMIRFLEASRGFSHLLEVAAVAPGHKVQVEADIEPAEGRLVRGGTSWNQEALLRVVVKVFEAVEVTVATGVLGPGPDLEVTYERLKLEQLAGEMMVEIFREVSVSLEVPGREVVLTTPYFSPVDLEILENRAIIQGLLQEQVYYTGTDGLQHHREVEIPFTQLVDLPGLKPGMRVEVSPHLGESEAELEEAGSSLKRRVVIQVAIRAVAVKELEVVTDVRGPGIAVAKESLQVERLVGYRLVRLMQGVRVNLPSCALRVARVSGVTGEVSSEVIQGQVIVEGYVHQHILYIDPGSVERYHLQRVRFTTLVAVPGARPGMAVQVTAAVEHIGFILDQGGTRLDEKMVVAVRVKVLEAVALEVVNSLEDQVSLALPALPGSRERVEERSEVHAVQGTLRLRNPPAVIIREARVSLADIRAVAEPGAVVVSGQWEVEVYYVSPDRAVFGHLQGFPFSRRIQFPSCQGGEKVFARGAATGVNSTLHFIPGRPYGEELHLEALLQLTAGIPSSREVRGWEAHGGGD